LTLKLHYIIIIIILMSIVMFITIIIIIIIIISIYIVNFDHPSALETSLLIEHINQLKLGALIQ